MKLEKDYHDAYNAWSADTNSTTSSDLLNKVRPVIDTALQAYGGSSSKSPTLRSKARRLALDSFGSYDPNKGTMKTHLMSQLQGLRRYSQQEQQIISVPEQVAMDLQRTEAAGRELEDRLGRPASDSELADYTGLSVKRLTHIRKARHPVATGTIMQERGDAGMFMPATRPVKDDSTSWVEFVYSDLNETDQYILERSMGLHGHPALSPGQLAKDLKLSPGAISQRMQKIQNKLDQRDELGML